MDLRIYIEGLHILLLATPDTISCEMFAAIDGVADLSDSLVDDLLAKEEAEEEGEMVDSGEVLFTDSSHSFLSQEMQWSECLR